ncbi:MAG: ORF6N domain-containing protein [Candidatus Omnitrophica bacterium]|nr:ORF6N domain-containing protein [Candidatus Omnitrophota bacterium]
MKTNNVEIDVIENMIYVIRGQKVMLDSDLAMLYGVETKRLKEQVKRNIKRFPIDFMFELSFEEAANLRSQIATSRLGLVNLRSQNVTSNLEHGGSRYFPYVFTEQGVAMLSSVLKSDRAIQVNISIMRTFTKLRQMMYTHKELREKIESMEKKYDKQFHVVFAALKRLFGHPEKPKNKIGFHQK